MPTLSDVKIADRLISDDKVPQHKKRSKKSQNARALETYKMLEPPPDNKPLKKVEKGNRQSCAYDETIGRQIAEKLALTTHPIRAILSSDVNFPSDMTYYKWRRENKEFSDLIKEAYRQRVENHFLDEIIEIADDETIEIDSRKVRIEARKWMIDKIMGKLYAESGADAAKNTEELVLTMRELVSKYRKEY